MCIRDRLRDRDTFVTTAKELGAKVNVQNANGDVKEQISQIDYLISQNVDVIVIIAVDCEAISDAVKRAKNKGISVISYDRLIKNVDIDLYISCLLYTSLLDEETRISKEAEYNALINDYSNEIKLLNEQYNSVSRQFAQSRQELDELLKKHNLEIADVEKVKYDREEKNEFDERISSGNMQIQL